MRLDSLPEIYDLARGGDLITVEGGVGVRDAAQLMRDKNIGAVIVCDRAGDIAGIFTERDLMNRVVAEGRDPGKTAVAEVMTPNPETIDLSATVDQVVGRMLDAHIRHLPVVDAGEDGDGRLLVGIVSARDVLRMRRDSADAV